MDWQEYVALTVVCATVGLGLARWVRRRKAAPGRMVGCHCGCGEAGGRGRNITVRGRKGESARLSVSAS